MSSGIFTIGHSTHDCEVFLGYLQTHGISALADVRSMPYSRFNPQFGREKLCEALESRGIRYLFLGKELGARCRDDSCYVGDKVQYPLLAQTELFRAGIARVVEGMKTFRLALMCAEKDPLDCHRTILVARELIKLGHDVQHILADGTIEAHEHAMSRLINQLVLKHAGNDLFRSGGTLEDQAYGHQGQRIAYQRKPRPASRRRSAGRHSSVCEPASHGIYGRADPAPLRGRRPARAGDRHL